MNEGEVSTRAEFGIVDADESHPLHDDEGASLRMWELVNAPDSKPVNEAGECTGGKVASGCEGSVVMAAWFPIL